MLPRNPACSNACSKLSRVTSGVHVRRLTAASWQRAGTFCIVKCWHPFFDRFCRCPTLSVCKYHSNKARLSPMAGSTQSQPEQCRGAALHEARRRKERPETGATGDRNWKTVSTVLVPPIDSPWVPGSAVARNLTTGHQAASNYFTLFIFIFIFFIFIFIFLVYFVYFIFFIFFVYIFLFIFIFFIIIHLPHLHLLPLLHLHLHLHLLRLLHLHLLHLRRTVSITEKRVSFHRFSFTHFAQVKLRHTKVTDASQFASIGHSRPYVFINFKLEPLRKN